MKMTLKLIFLIVIFSSISSCAQRGNEKYLLGKWVVYKTTDQTGDSLTPEGTIRSNAPDTLEFLADGKLNIYRFPIPGEPPQVSDYSFVNDTILRLGNRQYIFRKIDQNRMILDDYRPDLPLIKSLLNREYWCRIEE